MNPDLKYYILGGVIGSGVGFVAGSIICDLYFPEYELVEGDGVTGNKSLRNTDEYFENPALKKKVEKKELRTPVDKVTDYTKIYQEKRERYVVKAAPQNLEELVDSIDTAEEMIEAAVEDIRIITKAEYDGLVVDKVVLHYYARDEVLTTESGEPIEDPEFVLGVEALEHLGAYEKVYVQNDELGFAYDVSKLNRYFNKPVVAKKEKGGARKQTDEDSDD